MMKFSDRESAYINSQAFRIGVNPAALMAIIEVESNGVKGTMINNKFEPVIRYEGHFFDRLCDPKVRQKARDAGVSSPRAGGIKNPNSQLGRYQLLARAAKIDSNAAYSACSWGIGQVMGANWKSLGYKNLRQFIDIVRRDFTGQVEVMVRFIEVNNLVRHIKALDWSAFARAYNGPNYRVNKYDEKMAEAYRRYSGSGSVSSNRSGNLRIGSKGAGVREIQNLLVIAGYNLNVDGDFGPATERAVQAFQRDNNLTVDGIVGKRTQLALSAYRDSTKPTTGQEPVTQIKEVQEGVGTSVVVPTGVVVIKDQLESVVDKLNPYPMFDNIVGYLQLGLSVIAVVVLIGGLVYAYRGWRNSRINYSGTSINDEVNLPNIIEEDKDYVELNLPIDEQ